MLHAIYGSIYISKGLRNGWQSNSPLQLGGWPWTCVQVRTCNNSDIKWQFIASFEPGLSISVGYKQHIAAVFDICQMWLLSPIVIWNLYYLQFHQFKPMKITNGTWSDEHWTLNSEHRPTECSADKSRFAHGVFRLGFWQSSNNYNHLLPKIVLGCSTEQNNCSDQPAFISYEIA